MQMWLFPAQEHVLVDRSSDYEMWIGVFRVGLVRRACTSPATVLLRKSDPKGIICRQLSREQSSRLSSLHAELSAKEKESDDPATINAGLAWLLLTSWAAFRATSVPAAGQDVHPAVEKAARILRDEDQTLSLDELAARCGLSPHRLSRIFKEQTELPLVRYRQRQMLQRFLAAMQSGRSTNLLGTALDAGFGSYPQFHRVFRQIIGISPREYFRGRRV
jgi:AraC-like DNA-binding protein